MTSEFVLRKATPSADPKLISRHWHPETLVHCEIQDFPAA